MSVLSIELSCIHFCSGLRGTPSRVDKFYFTQITPIDNFRLIDRAPTKPSKSVPTMSTVVKPSNTLLARYLAQLATHPLRTKATTTGSACLCAARKLVYTHCRCPGVLCFLQEVLGSHLAGVPTTRLPRGSPAVLHILARSHVDLKALKMFIYGFLVSAPLCE